MNDLSPNKYGRLRPWILLAIAWVVAFDVAWVWQRVSGTHANEFGAHPRETTLYVTGLMLRDFAVSASSDTKAREFVAQYATHYPNVDRRLWPPLFYAVESAWMVAFGTSRVTLLLLMAALAATGATLLGSALAKDFGNGIAILGGAIFLCLPLSRESYGFLLAEPLGAILILAAALKWGRYLEDGRTVDALAFGGMCGLALLTDLSAFGLVFQAPLTAFLARRNERFQQPATWAGIALGGLIAGSAYFLIHHGSRNLGSMVRGAVSWEHTRAAIPFYFGKLGLALGFVLLLFFVIGLICQLRGGALRSGKWITLAVTLVAGFGVRTLVFEPLEARHLVPLIPITVMFATAGLNGLLNRFSTSSTESTRPAPANWKPAAVAWALAILGVITAQLFSGIELHRDWTGYGESAKEIVAATSTSSGPQRILLSSDAAGEDALISEVARRDKRPNRILRRSNRELFRKDQLSGRTRPRFETSDELAAWFPLSGFTTIVLDQSIAEEDRSEVHDQLVRATEDHSEIFWATARVTVTRGNSENGVLTVYRLRNPLSPGK
jgi:hypothetical protein